MKDRTSANSLTRDLPHTARNRSRRCNRFRHTHHVCLVLRFGVTPVEVAPKSSFHLAHGAIPPTSERLASKYLSGPVLQKAIVGLNVV
jgi:hypothetical protein